jgi:hypothetical protein
LKNRLAVIGPNWNKGSWWKVSHGVNGFYRTDSTKDVRFFNVFEFQYDKEMAENFFQQAAKQWGKFLFSFLMSFLIITHEYTQEETVDSTVSQTSLNYNYGDVLMGKRGLY